MQFLGMVCAGDDSFSGRRWIVEKKRTLGDNQSMTLGKRPNVEERKHLFRFDQLKAGDPPYTAIAPGHVFVCIEMARNKALTLDNLAEDAAGQRPMR